MNLLSRFTRPDYKDGREDFLAHYSYTAPENFNFAREVIDEYARLAPDQVAMIWTNDAGEEHIFTFAELARLSIKAANALRALGVQKGEPVLLMLKRRYEYWLCALGLMRIGAIQIPATHQLQEKDITYRVNAADARTLICVGEEELLTHVRASKEKCPHLRVIAALGGKHEGFEDFDRLLAEAPDTMDGCYDPAPEDVMLIYFTSGTTGMPKMLAHDFRYGLGHLITGAFWHNLTDKSIHITTADSGWAKCGWGKFYGSGSPARSTSSTISTASTPEDAFHAGQIPCHQLLRAADHLPLPHQGGFQRSRPLRPPVGHLRRRAAQPGGLQPVSTALPA